MTVVELLPRVLFVLGVGFLIANLRAARDLWRWTRRRRRRMAGVGGAQAAVLRAEPGDRRDARLLAAQACWLSALFVPLAVRRRSSAS